MKKIKKLFKFLPVVCLSLISCLSAVLFQDHKLESTYADSLLLVSSHSQSNFGIDYNIANGNVHLVYSYDAYLYRNSFDNTYNYVVYVTFHNGDSFAVRNNVRFDGYAGDRTFTLSFNSLVDNGYITSLRGLELRFNSIVSESSLFYVGANPFYGNGAMYFFNMSYSLLLSGFDTKTISLPLEWSGTEITNYMFNLNVSPQYYNSFASSTLNNSSLNAYVLSYDVDLTQTNYDVGYSDGYSVGYTDGFNSGYASGNNDGYSTGYSDGFSAGADSREQDISNAYDDGYNTGYADGYSVDSTSATIFSGILQIGMLPINVLLAIFNFEILGINLSAFVSAILTVCLTIIVVRTITGKKE